MATKRRKVPKVESEYSNPVNVIVSIMAIGGIIAGLYSLYRRTQPPPDRYETTVEQHGPRLDAPDSRANDPISVSDKMPGKK